MQFAHKGIWPWQVSAQDDFQSCRENKDMVCFRKASRVRFQRRAQPLQKSTAQVQDQRGREWLLQVSAQGKRLEGEAQTTPSTFEPLKKKFVCVCVFCFIKKLRVVGQRKDSSKEVLRRKDNTKYF